MQRRNKKTKSVGNGEGTLFYSEALKKWIYQYYVDGDPKRKKMTQRKKETVKDFKSRVTELKNKLNNGTYIANSKDTLCSILEKHIKQKFQDGITIENSYSRDLNTLEEIKKCCDNFCNRPIQKVTVDDIEMSKSKIRGYSQSTIDKIWRLLKKGFKIAYSRRKIPYNIMEDETLTKPISKCEEYDIEALTIEEQKKFENLLNGELRHHKHRNITKLQLNTAMRIGEVLARSKYDFDKQSKKLCIHNTLTRSTDGKTVLGKHTKTYNKKLKKDLGKRTIPLFDDSEEIIQQELSKKINNIYGLLFWDYEKNTFISGSTINSWLKRINKKYRITDKELTTHVLRHTRITRWREAGIAMSVIQYWSGHVEGSKITDNTYFTLQEEFIDKEYQKLNEA